jgi:hypothetical protein
LVEEIHGQLKSGGEKKRVLLDWRENGNRRRRRGQINHFKKQTRLEAIGGKKDVRPCTCLYIDSIFTWIATRLCGWHSVSDDPVFSYNEKYRTDWICR